MEGKGARERPTNWINSANNIVASYPSGIAHGLQKDAVQNGWDACPTKTKSFVIQNWSMKFELVKYKEVNYLIIEDFGTHGLTGMKVSNDFGDDEVPPEEERWAKWESFASGKTSQETLGERGQGKMLYIAASKDYILYYDSLRDDGTYRAGWTCLTVNSSPLYSWDEDEGRSEIAKLGIPRLNHQGSRFIIVNPNSAILNSIHDGTFANYIAETWWPIILKYGARIKLVSNGETQTISMPDRYPIEKSGKEGDKVWVNENVAVFTNRKKDKFTIKKIAFKYQSDIIPEFPDDLRGIGVYRAGMRIPTLPFPRQYGDHVYGYVDLGDAIDKKIKADHLEMPNHYTFKDKGLWRSIKTVIENEMDAFVNQELSSSLSDKQKKRNQRTTAQNRALAMLKNITQGWPMSSSGRGLGGGSDDDDDDNIKKIGIRLSNFVFPNEGNIPRLNYGQSIEDYFVLGFNKTDKDIRTNLRISLLSGDRQLLEVENIPIELKSHSRQRISSEHTLTATEKLFLEPGEYRIIITLTDDTPKKAEIDKVVRKIWIEEDPRLSAPFDIKDIAFSEIDDSRISKTMEWFLSHTGSGKYTLFYNIEHPTYLRYEEDELQTRYLAEIFSAASMEMVIKNLKAMEPEEAKKIEKLPIDVEILLEGDADKLYKEVVAAMSKIKYEMDNDS